MKCVFNTHLSYVKWITVRKSVGHGGTVTGPERFESGWFSVAGSRLTNLVIILFTKFAVINLECLFL